MRHNLIASVPALDHYRAVLAFVVHGQILYPAEVDTPFRSQAAIKASTIEEVRTILAELLETEAVQRVVVSLIAQANSTTTTA